MELTRNTQKGPSIKYVTVFLMIFTPLLPLSQNCHKSWTPGPLKVCHTSEQKVNKQILRRMETALNNYNRYYILNNNKRPYWVFLINPEILLTSWISYNSEGDSCSIKFVLCMIKKYKIKHKIVNCVKIESVDVTWSLPPVTNCHTFSDSLPPWSETHFMDGLKEHQRMTDQFIYSRNGQLDVRYTWTK